MTRRLVSWRLVSWRIEYTTLLCPTPRVGSSSSLREAQRRSNPFIVPAGSKTDPPYLVIARRPATQSTSNHPFPSGRRSNPLHSSTDVTDALSGVEGPPPHPSESWDPRPVPHPSGGFIIVIARSAATKQSIYRTGGFEDGPALPRPVPHPSGGFIIVIARSAATKQSIPSTDIFVAPKTLL
jgi:hypothetical protein